MTRVSSTFLLPIAMSWNIFSILNTDLWNKVDLLYCILSFKRQYIKIYLKDRHFDSTWQSFFLASSLGSFLPNSSPHHQEKGSHEGLPKEVYVDNYNEFDLPRETNIYWYFHHWKYGRPTIIDCVMQCYETFTCKDMAWMSTYSKHTTTNIWTHTTHLLHFPMQWNMKCFCF